MKQLKELNQGRVESVNIKYSPYEAFNYLQLVGGSMASMALTSAGWMSIPFLRIIEPKKFSKIHQMNTLNDSF